MAKIPPTPEGPINAEVLCDLPEFVDRTLGYMHSFFQQLLITIQDSFGSQDVKFKVPIGQYYDLGVSYRRHEEQDEFLVSYIPKKDLRYDGRGGSDLVIGTYALACFYVSAMDNDIAE